MTIKIFTIGFTKKSAEKFFNLLEKAGVKRVIDVRRHNSSQLAGYAKRDDLKFFLKRIAGIDYRHIPELAPTEEILKNFRKNELSWENYEERFLRLLRERKIKEKVTPETFHQACLLCSEPAPDYCHRRLVAEYIAQNLEDVKIEHLV